MGMKITTASYALLCRDGLMNSGEVFNDLYDVVNSRFLLLSVVIDLRKRGFEKVLMNMP